MDERESSATRESTDRPEPITDLPPGNHPLEVGARRGIGPLSPSGGEVWHGNAHPCVSCGQLVLRDNLECEHCGQDLSPEMIEKMRMHAGPWYVLEHVRPFPGVSLERILRQIRRGLITETSILRGPSTDHQWRFAVESPGLCRYFGRCWSCHEKVSPSDTYCQHCLSYLSFERPRPAPGVPPSAQSVASDEATGAQSRQAAGRAPSGFDASASGMRSHEAVPAGKSPTTRKVPDSASSRAEHLKQLSAVVDRTDLPTHEAVWDEPPRIAGVRATWVALALLIIVVTALMFVTRSRSTETPPPRPAAPGMVLASQ